MTSYLLTGRSFGKGGKTKHVKGKIVEGNWYVSCRSGFILSGFFLPETKSGRIPSFAIAFFLPDNQAGPGKPVFSIGESFQSHFLSFDSTPWRRVSAQPNPAEGRAQYTTEKAHRWATRPTMVVYSVQVRCFWLMDRESHLRSLYNERLCQHASNSTLRCKSEQCSLEVQSGGKGMKSQSILFSKPRYQVLLLFVDLIPNQKHRWSPARHQVQQWPAGEWSRKEVEWSPAAEGGLDKFVPLQEAAPRDFLVHSG